MLLLPGLFALPFALTYCTGFRGHSKCERRANGAGFCSGVDIHGGKVVAVSDIATDHHQSPYGGIDTIAIEASDIHRGRENEQYDQAPSSSSLHRLSSRALQTASSASSSSISYSTTSLPASGFVGCGICGTSYLAGVGDTFNSVAAYCNVQPQDLKAANSNISGANLTNIALKVPCSGHDPANCGVCGTFYIVQTLDTLSNASLNCRIDINFIEAANPGIDYDNVFGGQFISIPCGEQNVSTSLVGCGACGFVYKASANEKVQKVVQTCGLSEQMLQNSNPSIQNTTNILAGQQLHLPCTGNYSQNCGLCGTNFTIAENDTLQSVSAKCRVGMISLQQKNPGVTDDTLVAGEVVNIPCPEVVNSVCSSNCNGSTQVLSNETTLGEVAKRCNVSIDLLSYANSIANLQTEVKSGQILLVPCAQVGKLQTNCSICGSSITLQAYLPLTQLAEACRINTTDIERLNPSVDLTLLGPGDSVALPCYGGPWSHCGACGIAYVAQAGDTLPSIAVKCATMATQLLQSNPGLNWSTTLDQGALLTMPCGAPAITAVANAVLDDVVAWWWWGATQQKRRAIQSLVFCRSRHYYFYVFYLAPMSSAWLSSCVVLLLLLLRFLW